MYEPNYKRIKDNLDRETNILASNIFSLVKAKTQKEIVERKSADVIDRELQESIKACFWRGFWTGSKDGKLDIESQHKNKDKNKLDSTFSFSNFSQHVINFAEDENKKPKRFDLVKRSEPTSQTNSSSISPQTLRVYKELLLAKQTLQSEIKSLQGSNYPEANIRYKQDEIKKIEANIKKFEEKNPEINNIAIQQLQQDLLAAQAKPKTTTTKKQKQERFQNVSVPKPKDDISAKTKSEKTKREISASNVEANDVNTYRKKKLELSRETNPNTDKAIKLESELKALETKNPKLKEAVELSEAYSNAKNNNDGSKEREALIRNLARRLEKEFGLKTQEKDAVEIKRVDSAARKALDAARSQGSKNRNLQQALEKELLSPTGIFYNPKKDNIRKARQAAAFELDRTRSREMFINLNTEYPALFSSDSFFQTYLDRRSAVIKDQVSEFEKENVKKLIVAYSKNSGTTGKSTIEHIQKLLADPKQAELVNEELKSLNEARNSRSLRMTNAEYAKRYRSWLSRSFDLGDSDTGSTKVKTKNLSKELEKLAGNNESRLKLFNDYLKDLENLNNEVVLTPAQQREAANRARSLSQNIKNQISSLYYDDDDENDSDVADSKKKKKRLASEKQLNRLDEIEIRAREEPNGLATFDRNKKISFDKQRQKKLETLLGTKAYAKAIKNGTFDEDGNLLLGSGGVLKLEEALEQVGLKTDKKLLGRAKAIAKTEVSAAYNMGRLQVYLDNGVRYVQFTATLDEVTTIFCKSLHKKIYPLYVLLEQSMTRTFFPETGEPEYSPYNRAIADRNGIAFWAPPCHVNCRSFLLPIYTDEVRDQIESNLLIKTQKLEVANSLKGSSINEQLKRRGLDSLKEQDLKSIISKQRKQRENLTISSQEKFQSAADLFTSGYRFLVNKFRASIKDDSKINFNPEEILKNDKSLTKVLLGSGLVLGFGAMLYFFSKSNLADKLRDFVSQRLGVANLNNVRPEEIITAIGAVKTVVDQVPEGIIDDIFNQENKKVEQLGLAPKKEDIVSLLPKDKNKIDLKPKTSAVGQFDKIQVANKKVLDLALSQGLSLEDVANGFFGNNLSFAERRKLAIHVVLESIQTKVYNEFKPDYGKIMRQGLRNKRLAEGFDLADVKEIKRVNSGKNLIVVFKPGKGGNTFLSMKDFQAVFGSAAKRERLQAIKAEVDREIQLLDEWATNIQGSSDQDQFEKGLLLNQRRELADIQNGIEKALDGFLRYKPTQIEDLPEELWGDVARQFGQDAIPEVNKAISDMASKQGRLLEISEEIIGELDSAKDFDVEFYGQNIFENFDELTFGEDDLPNLESLGFQVSETIKDLKKRFFSKNKPYTLQGISKQFGKETQAEINQLTAEIKDAMTILKRAGQDPNNVIKEIDDFYRNTIQEKFDLMLDVQERINIRIKELEQNK